MNRIKILSSTSSKDTIISNTYILIDKAYSLNINPSLINVEKNTLNSIYYSINDVIPINSYKILSDIGISYPTADITSLQNLSGKIYITDPRLQYIYSISDISESTANIFESLSSGISIPEYITYSVANNSLYLYDLNKGLLGISSNATNSPIISPINGAKIAYIQSYAGNIYLLDSSNGVLYEANTSNLSYTKILSSQLLKGARSFAVDGNIFVINDNGNIIRFYANQQTPFGVSNSSAMEYPLKNLSFIYDNQYLNDIYVLDPEHKRIVVLQKPQAGALNTVDYKFIKQYVYSGVNGRNIFSHMSAMALSSNGQYIYLLSGSKIIKISTS